MSLRGTRSRRPMIAASSCFILALLMVSTVLQAAAQERTRKIIADRDSLHGPASSSAAAGSGSGPALRRDAQLWYFGYGAGLSFSGGSAQPITDGKLFTDEGCAAVCDRATGALLFYTDGDTVWNARHAPMPNGTGLAGCYSSAQAAVIIPDPCKQSRYYIFTTDCGSQPSYPGLNYSIVDMTQDGGRGDVIVKNSPLASDSSTEMLTATRHANGYDYWVVMHVWGTDEFRAYPVTAGGVGAPVVSRIGEVYYRDDHDAVSADFHWRSGIGTMKFSADTRRLAVARPYVAQPDSYSLSSVELYDFDPATGLLSNQIELVRTTAGRYYGVSFSPDDSKLYTASYAPGQSGFWQFDLSSGDPATMQSSISEIMFDNNVWSGPLQLGPDGRIYVGYRHERFLGVVRQPNNPAITCDFVFNGVDLAGKITYNGLPNFIDADMFRGVQDTLPVRITMKVNNDSPHHGDSLLYTISVCNNGSEAMDIRIEDLLPAGLTYLDGFGAYPGHAFGTLSPGECRTVVLRAIVDPSMPVGVSTTNCLTVVPGSECAYRVVASDSNCAAVRVQSSGVLSDVAVEESVDPKIIAPDHTVTYTIRVRNVASTPVRSVVVQVSLPAGLTHLSYAASAPATYDDAVGVLTIPSLDVGAESVMTILCKAGGSDVGTITSRAFLAGIDPRDDDRLNDTAAVDLTVRYCPNGNVAATGGVAGEHGFNPRAPGEIPVMLEAPLDDEEITRIRITLRFNDWLLVPVNPGTLSGLTRETILKGWHVESIRKEPGALTIELVAPDGEYLRGVGALLRVPFRMYLGSTLRTEIGASIEFPDYRCATIDARGGFAHLDSVCGLSLRLIQIGTFKYALGQNIPNPFNPTTTIPFSIGLDAPTRLEIFDPNGRLVTTLVDTYLTAGEYEVEWDATPYGTGTYYYRLTSGSWTETRRTSVVK